ncbi:MAG: putative solute:sodium symporter small subunit [Crocinitomicaceae bacterium]|jgi:putative solute:sodium symporter small subunit
MKIDHPRAHRRACLRLVLSLLLVWFTVSLGCGVLFRDWLDANVPNVGTAPFGFWMAQQGSIICFLLILFIYAWRMNKLDAKHGYADQDE